jgi:hypothetical protein
MGLARFLRVALGLVFFGSLIMAPPAARADMVFTGNTAGSFTDPNGVNVGSTYKALSFEGVSFQDLLLGADPVDVALGYFTLGAPLSSKDSYNEVEFTFLLNIVDPSPGITEELTADISGWVRTKNGSTSTQVFISFDEPEQTVQFGNHTLTISLDPWTLLLAQSGTVSGQPGLLQAPTVGDIQLHATFTDSVPEPGIIVSFFVMLAGAAAFLWRLSARNQPWLVSQSY